MPAELAAHIQCMTENILRKNQTGEPGNKGEFGSKANSEPAVLLTDTERGADEPTCGGGGVKSESWLPGARRSLRTTSQREWMPMCMECFGEFSHAEHCQFWASAPLAEDNPVLAEFSQHYNDFQPENAEAWLEDIATEDGYGWDAYLTCTGEQERAQAKGELARLAKLPAPEAE